LSLAKQRTKHSQQRALNHDGSLLGGRLVCVLPTHPVSGQISSLISNSNGKARPPFAPAAGLEGCRAAGLM